MYEWDWDDDGIYDENHTYPTTTYSWSEEGSYPVTLRVTDNESAHDYNTKTIIVNEPFYFIHITDTHVGSILDGDESFPWVCFQVKHHLAQR